MTSALDHPPIAPSQGDAAAPVAAERPWFLPRTVFLAAWIIAMGFALATDRVWEDFYITYKSSKNLVAGKGLVFHEGEKVHTFTSPLGVLLPAVCHVLTFGHSDKAALWLFRVLSAGAFAGAVTLLYQLAGRLRWPAAAAGLLALWLMVEPKTVDFSINGMETGLLVASVASILWGLFAKPARQWLVLGLAWGLMMWTRPDGFIYIAALSAGVWIFNRPESSGQTRWQWVVTFFKAGLVCTAVYLPWFAWAWWYYGTPVPHTVIAKSLAAGPRDLLGALETWLKLPLALIGGQDSIPATFMPSSFQSGGWPDSLQVVMRTMAGLACLCWLLPWLNGSTRAVSWAASVLMAYLGYFPAYVYAWYMPGPACLVLFVMASVGAQLLVGAGQLRRAGVLLAGVAWLVLNGWLLVQLGRLSKVEQHYLEDGHRRQIGLWLKEHAQPGDTMFMECLGYLGYFSELKTLDFPGLSSPEVVAVARRWPNPGWPLLIDELKPDWLVLRPSEAADISDLRPHLLNGHYQQVKVFDASPQVENRAVYGQGLLVYDSIFIVFKRQSP